MIAPDVTGPPVTGELVVIEVIVPGVWHDPSAPRYCVPEHPLKRLMITLGLVTIDGTPVPLVLNINPDARLANDVPLILATVGFGYEPDRSPPAGPDADVA